MKALRISPMYKCVGLVDADLMDNGTRHPNLVLLKIAGFLYNNHIRFELITSEEINLSRYTHIFLSRVFSFTTLPKFYTQAVGTKDEAKFHIGGTGFYATETSVSEYRKKRTEDMQKLENDTFLNQFPNTYGGQKTSESIWQDKCHIIIFTMNMLTKRYQKVIKQRSIKII